MHTIIKELVSANYIEKVTVRFQTIIFDVFTGNFGSTQDYN